MRFPIRHNDFRKIREAGELYVDKTLLIKDCMDSGSKAILISRPGGFGKTLNMDMLKCFFSIREKDQRQLFSGLNIMAAGEDYVKMMGKFPVIFLTFKDFKANDYVSSKSAWANIIAGLYQEHQYLLSSDHIPLWGKEKIEKILL